MSTHARRWLIAALIALALGSSHLLDGPSEIQAARDTAAAARDVERSDLADTGPRE